MTFDHQIWQAGTSMRVDSMKQFLVTSSRQDYVILKRCYNFLSARAMIIIFEQNNYEETQLPLINSHDNSVTWSYGVT